MWLDYDDQSTLLCTLRPDRCEQFPLNLTLCSTDSSDEASAGKDYYTLRLEVQTLSKRRRSDDAHQPALPLQCFEIHIVGSSLSAPHDHTDEEKGSEEGICPL